MMYLRWSLVVLTFTVCTDIVVLGVPIPGPKGKGIKENSSTYRANAAQNQDQIDRTPGGTWQTTQGAGARGPRPGEHADHMLEAQTVNAALRAQGHTFGSLPPHHQTALRSMLNDQENMQFVHGRTNILKGGATGAGLRGHAPSAPNHDRDGYTRQTVAPAVHTADRMDHYLTNAGYRGNVHETHMAAMRNAGVVGQHSPTPLRHQNAAAGPSNSHSRSSSGSSGSGPHTPTPMGRQTTLPIHPHPHAGPSTPPNTHQHAHPSVHDVRREQAHGPPSSHPPSPTPNHPHDTHHPHDAHAHPVTPPRPAGSHNTSPPGAPRKPHRSNSF